MYNINDLLNVCILVMYYVQEQNRQISRRGWLHLEYGQVTLIISWVSILL